MAMNSQSIVVQEAPGGAQQLFLLFHGYGANAEDLVPLGQRLAREFPQATVVSVAAPEPMAYPGGRQWFSLDGINDLNRVTRIAQALPDFLQTIRDWQTRCGVTAERTALVGFSQGTMMVLEASLADPAPAGRVVGLSGRFGRLPTAAPASVSFHLLHGKEDTVVPYKHTVEAAHRLLDLGGDVTADVYPFVGHEIREEIVQTVLQRLTTHVPKRLWDEAMQAAPANENES
ncbi:MAG TPA: esterase [Steroidobacteraceae bacterium]